MSPGCLRPLVGERVSISIGTGGTVELNERTRAHCLVRTCACDRGMVCGSRFEED